MSLLTESDNDRSFPGVRGGEGFRVRSRGGDNEFSGSESIFLASNASAELRRLQSPGTRATAPLVGYEGLL